MSNVATQIVRVKGVRSSVMQAGPTDQAEAVLFVHGNPGPATDWLSLLTPAGEFARPVAPDMPGYGDAKPRGFRCTIVGYAEHLAGLLDSRGAPRSSDGDPENHPTRTTALPSTSLLEARPRPSLRIGRPGTEAALQLDLRQA